MGHQHGGVIDERDAHGFEAGQGHIRGAHHVGNENVRAVDDQGVAVRFGFQHLFHAHHGGAAVHVHGDHAHAQHFFQRQGQLAGVAVGVAAGFHGADDLDGLGGIISSGSGAHHAKGQREDHGENEKAGNQFLHFGILHF